MLGAEDRRRALTALLRPGARVLDVGCGAGEFVFLLREGAVEAAGIEPGEAYADFSRRVLGIPIQTATVDTAVVQPDSQDVITMFHMLGARGGSASDAGDDPGLASAEWRSCSSWRFRTWSQPSRRRDTGFTTPISTTSMRATLGALGESAGLQADPVVPQRRRRERHLRVPSRR